MSSDGYTRYEASFCENGLFEVRERGDPDRWITCDEPIEVEP